MSTHPFTVGQKVRNIGYPELRSTVTQTGCILNAYIIKIDNGPRWLAADAFEADPEDEQPAGTDGPFRDRLTTAGEGWEG